MSSTNLSNGTTTSGQGTDRGRAAAGSTGRFVRRAGLTLAGLVAATSFGPLAGVASADTPPAPQPGPVIAAPAPGPHLDLDIKSNDPGVNQNKVTNISWVAGDTFADLTFRSTAPSVMVQFSTQAPKTVDGKLTMGAVQPVHLVGTPIGGGQHQFKLSPGGLTPATTYHTLFSIPGKPGQQPNQAVTFGSTRVRHVRMTPLSIHVVDDGDQGIKGKGEIVFGFRVAPDGKPEAKSVWGSWTKEQKLSSGDDLNLAPLGLGHEVTTRANTAVVQIQGQENDVFGGKDFGCGLGMESAPAWAEMAPKQTHTSCYETSYADGVAQLPTGRYTGVKSQVVKVTTHRTPSLRFTGQVRVDVWYS